MVGKKAQIKVCDVCLVPKIVRYKPSKDLQLLKTERLMKIIHYELVKVIIDFLGLVEVIINIVVQHYCLFNPIISDYSSVFILQF